MINKIQEELIGLECPEQAKTLQRFFKTGKGEYGEGDRFRGIKVPQIRNLIRDFPDVPLTDIELLLKSNFHEDRLTALLMMVHRFEKKPDIRDAIYKLYCDSFSRINNWDLVDLSAPQIIGGYLNERSRAPLYKWAKSPILWERRISILATLHFIRKGNFADTLKISEILLHDTHDLIHKAVGWMLREVGKRDLQTEEAFLITHYRKMPRTMLRYSIERFTEKRRQEFLKGTI